MKPRLGWFDIFSREVLNMKCNGCGADVSEQHEACSVCGREIATPLIDENSKY